MKMGENGRWKKTIMVPPGQYEYLFLVDGQWGNDPANDQICANCFGSTNTVLKIKKSGTLLATALCNIHGLWENSKTVKVK